MRIIYCKKCWNIADVKKVEEAAKTLGLSTEIDWDARECSLDDPTYEITVFEKGEDE